MSEQKIGQLTEDLLFSLKMKLLASAGWLYFWLYFSAG